MNIYQYKAQALQIETLIRAFISKEWEKTENCTFKNFTESTWAETLDDFVATI